MYENSIVHVKDCNSTGLDLVPLNSIIMNKMTGEIFQLTDKTGILTTTKFCDITLNLLMSNDKLTGAGLFYGGYDNTTVFNKTTLLSSAVLFQTETNVGTVRYLVSGANIGNNDGIFYSGRGNPFSYSSTVTILTSKAILKFSETAIGHGRWNAKGANVGTNALFYNGYENGYWNLTTLLTPSGTLAQAENSVGSSRDFHAGASVPISFNAMYYGGNNTGVFNNLITILTPTATLLQAETNVGKQRTGLSGTRCLSNLLFWGGWDNTSGTLSTATLLTPSGTLAQAETNVGTKQSYMASCNSGSNSLYFGGVQSNMIKVINSSVVVAQADSFAGTARGYLGGASV